LKMRMKMKFLQMKLMAKNDIFSLHYKKTLQLTAQSLHALASAEFDR
jgi:hypothetical protein